MVKEVLDFSSSMPFVALRNYIYRNLKGMKLNIVAELDEIYEKTFVNYGENGDIVENDWFLPNQHCFVFFVPNIEEIKFEKHESDYSENDSFLFIDKYFKVKFYDAESILWHKDIQYENTLRYCAKEGEIYVVKCSKCGVVSLVEAVGSWYCRNCEYQDGDSDVIGVITDFIPMFSKSYRENLKFSYDDSEYYYEDYEKPKSQKEKYDEYINSEEWKRKREEVFDLKGRECSICGTSYGIIQVHHLNYDYFGHEEENDYEDIIPLCKDCHDTLHNFIKENDDVIRDLKFDLSKLKDSFMTKYRYAIADAVYNRTKDLFVGIFNDKSIVKPYLDTIYGKCKCRNNIHPYFSSETLCKKLEKEGKI